jgi:hypothetical protein
MWMAIKPDLVVFPHQAGRSSLTMRSGI